MANIFTGTSDPETITPGEVSPTVVILGDAVAPGNGEDVIRSAAGDDVLNGSGGSDELDGGRGDDTLEGGLGEDLVDGGAGRDVFIQYRSEYELVASDDLIGGDTLFGDAGRDTVDYTDYDGFIEIDLALGIATFSDEPGREDRLNSIEDVLAGSGGARIFGSEAANSLTINASAFDVTEPVSISGRGGNDEIIAAGSAGLFANGGDGNDRIELHEGSEARALGGSGADVIVHFGGDDSEYFGGTGRDDVFAGSGDDLLVGGPGGDSMFGRGGNDELRGGEGNDIVTGDQPTGGGNGSDVLVGGPGDDVLNGCFQADDLYGGVGKDRFVFLSFIDSKPSGTDRLLRGTPEDSAGPRAFEAPGAETGDVIDVRRIDADETRDGNQKFRFGETGTGGLWLAEEGNRTVVWANVDADDLGDFKLLIVDGAVGFEAYTRHDFML